MVNLYPTFSVAAALSQLPKTSAQGLYFPAPLFDFTLGDFVRDGGGHIRWADGYTAWAQRAIKTVLVRKRSSPLYDPAYGTTLDTDLATKGRTNRERAITLDLRNALRRDPATADVDQFTFDYTISPRAVGLSCRLTPTLGSPVLIDVPQLFAQG